MSQVFYASPHDSMTWPNGAIGYRTGGGFDIVGPYAKVSNCPIKGTTVRLTCYATAVADTAFSVPACTRYRGNYIKGYFSNDGDNGTVFHVMDSHKHLFPELSK